MIDEEKTIKSVKFAFENVEVLTIDAKDIIEISLRGIKDNIHYVNWSQTYCDNWKMAEYSRFVISPNANKRDNSLFDKEMTIFQRFLDYNKKGDLRNGCKHEDLVDVDINYSDGSILNVHMNWTDRDYEGESNFNQRSYLDDDYNLVIEVHN